MSLARLQSATPAKAGNFGERNLTSFRPKCIAAVAIVDTVDGADGAQTIRIQRLPCGPRMVREDAKSQPLAQNS